MKKGALVIVFLMLLPACEKETESHRDFLRRAIERTEPLPRRFLLEDRSGGDLLSIKGTIEDDLRYEVSMLMNGEQVLQEVVADDARGLRFAQPEIVAKLFTGLGNSVSLDGLKGGAWIVDPNGASSISPRTGEEQGSDPVLRALRQFGHVTNAVGTSADVRPFNPEASDYRAQDDPFPPPPKGSQAVRYDLLPPPLPARRDPRTARPGEPDQTPGEEHFRRMAVYVQGGRVVEVRESINLKERLSELLIRLEDAGIQIPRGTSANKQGRALNGLNALRARGNLPPVRIHISHFKLIAVGGNLTITQPVDFKEGSLADVLPRGQVLQQST